MAPTKKRTSLRSRAPRLTSATTPNIAESAPKSNKLSKRAAKHSALLTNLHRTADGGIRKPRRRSKQASVPSLSALASALPELDDDEEEEEEEWEGISETSEHVGKARRRRGNAQAGEGKIVMKSLQHKPGSAKRKRVLEGREMERFRMNLAQLSSVNGKSEGMDGNHGSGDGGQGQQERWRALREFIGGSMQQEKAFAKT